MRLAALDTATIINDIDLPGFRLHPLKGDRQNILSIDVNKSWRLTFKFLNGDVFIITYENYHK
jgi:toxin HigB-1